MDFFMMSIFGSIVGILLIILIYIYLYAVYRERYIGYWILSWSLLLVRNVFFDSGMFNWIQSTKWFICFQVITFVMLLIFLNGAYLFIGKKVNKRWLYSAVPLFLGSIIFKLSDLPLPYQLLFPALFGGSAGIWLGITFIRHSDLTSMSKYILGYGYIFWGLHFLDMPFLISIAEFLPWGYLIEGVLRLIVAISTLLVYFDKTRNDLVLKEIQYRLLAENAVDIIYRYRINPTARFEYVSPAIFSVTGYEAENYYSDINHLVNLIHPEDRPLFKHIINNPFQVNPSNYSFRLVRKDQNVIWIEQTCVPIFDATGTLVAVEGIMRDVTSRKSLEQIALRVDRLNTVGEMAASVAHEIRNPMTTVRGYLQLLLSKKELSSYRDRFELMIQELDRTNDIIREYLCLAKDKRSDKRLCCLNHIIQTLLPLIQADSIASSIEVQCDLSDIPELWLDENEIRQLLLNLVRNGLEAMPSGGSLQIRTFIAEDKAVLAVSDQGTGIPEHILGNLGTPFLTTKDNGTGLGIPMCYRIAHRHQADIQVETSSQGTTFFTRFRLSSAE